MTSEPGHIGFPFDMIMFARAGVSGCVCVTVCCVCVCAQVNIINPPFGGLGHDGRVHDIGRHGVTADDRLFRHREGELDVTFFLRN